MVQLAHTHPDFLRFWRAVRPSVPGRLTLALLALAGALAGCARERVYVTESSAIIQPTPDKTVDAVIRGLGQVSVASAPLATVAVQPILATMAARQIREQPVAPPPAARQAPPAVTPAAPAGSGARAAPGPPALPTARPTTAVPTVTPPRPTVAPLRPAAPAIRPTASPAPRL